MDYIEQLIAALSNNPQFAGFSDLLAQAKQGKSQSKLAQSAVTLDDLAPYQMSPTRGYLAFPFGGFMGGGTPPLAAIMPAFKQSQLSYKLPNSALLPVMPEMQHGGSIGANIIPAGARVDTINNTPSNFPGGGGGQFAVSMLPFIAPQAFNIPKSQPFVEPIHNNKLVQPMPVHTMKKGGKIKKYPDGGPTLRRSPRPPVAPGRGRT